MNASACESVIHRRHTRLMDETTIKHHASGWKVPRSLECAFCRKAIEPVDSMGRRALRRKYCSVECMRANNNRMTAEHRSAMLPKRPASAFCRECDAEFDPRLGYAGQPMRKLRAFCTVECRISWTDRDQTAKRLVASAIKRPTSPECRTCGENFDPTLTYAGIPTGRGWSNRLYCSVFCHRRHRETAAKAREGNRKRRDLALGLTEGQRETMADAQQGLCAICRQPESWRDPRTGKTFGLALDHSHVTGKARGLLCSACNKGIGLLGDDPLRLRAAAAYLERSS